MSAHDPCPSIMSKLLIAFCLAMVATATLASLLGMARTIDRTNQPPYATDCEAVAELCEETTDE